MRILHVIAQLPATTGSGIYYRNLIHGFKTYHHDQRAVFACQDGEGFDFLPIGSQYPVEFKSSMLPFPIPGMSDIMPYDNTLYSQMDESMIKQWQRSFRNALEMVEKEFKPEVVVLHHLWMLTSMGIDCFFNAVKIGVCHHTDLRQATEHPDMVKRYVKNIEKLDKIFALSQSQSKSIEEIYCIPKEKISVLGGGFEQNIFYPQKEKIKNSLIQLVYASKIDPAKGIYALVDAFIRVRKVNPRVHLTVIGTPDGENIEKLERYFSQKDGFTFLNAMKQEDLAEFFRKMDIYVMPSFFEGLGLTALEALACGLRVVSTENEGLMELLGEDVNRSGVIEYVPLPRMETLDRACEEDMGKFIEALTVKLLIQIGRIEKGEPWEMNVEKSLQRHSWAGISKRAMKEIEDARLYCEV